MKTPKYLEAEGVESRAIAVCAGCIDRGADGWWVDVSEVGAACHQCNYWSFETRKYRRRRAFVCPDSCLMHEGEEWAFLTLKAISAHLGERNSQ